MKKSLSETILHNLLTELEMAIAAKNESRLAVLEKDISLMKKQIEDEKLRGNYGQ